MKTTPCDKFIDEGECDCILAHYEPPGSRRARGYGCTCAVIDNGHGQGYHYVKGQPRHYVFTSDCPLHGVEGVEIMDQQPTHIVNDHWDGLGLNDTIRIEASEVEYGAAHKYLFYIGDKLVGFLQFQQGPRLDPKSTPGVTEAAVLAVVADRVRGFQSGPFPARENALVLTKTEEAIHWTRHRAEERKRRGVLGKAEK